MLKFDFSSLFLYIKREKVNFILAFSPILLSFLLFVFFLYPHLKSYQEEKELLVKKKKILKRYEEKLKQKPPLKAPKKEYLNYLFVGKDPYIIISDLQEEFKKIDNLFVKSFQISSRRKVINNIENIRIYFNMQGDIKAVLEMLNILKNYKKAILIKRLNLSYLKRGKKEYLQINLEIEGLFRYS